MVEIFIPQQLAQITVKHCVCKSFIIATVFIVLPSYEDLKKTKQNVKPHPDMMRAGTTYVKIGDVQYFSTLNNGFSIIMVSYSWLNADRVSNNKDNLCSCQMLHVGCGNGNASLNRGIVMFVVMWLLLSAFLQSEFACTYSIINAMHETVQYGL